MCAPLRNQQPQGCRSKCILVTRVPEQAHCCVEDTTVSISSLLVILCRYFMKLNVFNKHCTKRRMPTTLLVDPHPVNDFCDACTGSICGVNSVASLTCIPSPPYHERNLVPYHFPSVISILTPASFPACKLLRRLTIRDAKLVFIPKFVNTIWLASQCCI